MVGNYKVITVCGSTRLKNEFMEAQKRLTLEGNIVISVGLFGHSGDNEVWENMDEGTLTKTKEMLDDMHKRKIDMADEIFVINVGGYIGSSTRSEIEYAKATGKTVRYLEDSTCSERPIACYRPDIHIEDALENLGRRRSSMSRYLEIMSLINECNVTEDQEFRRIYGGFYRLRRDSAWRDDYFQLMESYKCRQHVSASFGELLLRLFQKTGQIEASFASKMLASLNPDKPIWDSMVLKNLNLKLRGKSPEIRLSNAVVLYEKICDWYKAFLQTEDAKEFIKRFDEIFPEYEMISETKKIDFILWANR